MSELKPCAFCPFGGKAELFQEPTLHFYRVRCAFCQIQTPECWMAIDAIALWNRRTPAPEQTEQQRDLETIRHLTGVEDFPAQYGWGAILRTVIRLAEKADL
jgi:hypothetical protein